MLTIEHIIALVLDYIHASNGLDVAEQTWYNMGEDWVRGRRRTIVEVCLLLVGLFRASSPSIGATQERRGPPEYEYNRPPCLEDLRRRGRGPRVPLRPPLPLRRWSSGKPSRRDCVGGAQRRAAATATPRWNPEDVSHNTTASAPKTAW